MLYRTPKFNKECSKCNLGCGKGVSGQSQTPFSMVKLVIVSAYPGSREEKANQSLADNGDRVGIPDSNKSAVGAGEYLRFCLEQFLDNSKDFPDEFKPIEKYTYFTNAIKCSPQRGKDKITILDKHISMCRDTWLVNELDNLPPRVPIFACAGEAVKALLGIKESLYNNRNRVNYYKDHPVVVSTNPVEWEKYATKYVGDIERARANVVKILENRKLDKKKVDRVIGCTRWRALPGSPLYFVKQDLNLIKEEVVKFIKESKK